jgi:NAD(P)-dependent dehydrogenase (short-subunit alcohol dehydrogenase family)
MAKMDGKTVLITGSTDGVGRYVAARLAATGARVLIHGRDEGRAKALADEIRSDGHGDVADGHELRFAVNYLSGFLLAHLLLPLIKASAPSRIVNVASLGQHPIDFDDVMITKGYSGPRAYSQSKLSQIMFTIDLASELKGSGVTVNSLHPATYMNTTMVREGGITPISTVEQGGEAILHLAVGDDVAGKSGLFFNGMQQSQANAQAYDEAARQRLRALSLELTGLSR